MTFNEKLIAYQNRSEANFKERKTLGTGMHFSIALLLFFGSTLLAGFSAPFRMFNKKKAQPLGILEGTQENLTAILKQEELVLLDFWATWCGPCLMMDPILESFAQSTDQVQVVRIDADRNSKLLTKYSIKGLPQLLLFRKGKEIQRHAGPMTRAELEVFCFG